MFAIASRSRRNTLTNIVVHQSMRPWSANSGAMSVQVFDILNVIEAPGESGYPEPLCRLAGANKHQTFQNVCSYYDIRIVVRYRW